MFTNRTSLIKPLRIALLCGSALMLSSAFAEDGSNLTDLRAQPSGATDYQVGNASNPVLNEDGTNLADLRGQNAKSDSIKDSNSAQPVNEDGTDLSSLRAQYDNAATGYLTDSAGEPVRNSAGECFHTANQSTQVGPCVQPKQPEVVVEDDLDTYAYNLDDSEYFGFNKAVLTQHAQSDLDRLATDIADADQVVAITVTGHADSIGSNHYNRELAFRRADAVKAYLVSKGIPAEQISTQSEGSGAPLVTCSQDESTTQMISCLSPNRRVDVDALLVNHVDVRTMDYIQSGT